MRDLLQRRILDGVDQSAAGWTARASKRLADIIARSQIDYAEVYMAVWALGFGFIALIVPESVHARSQFLAILALALPAKLVGILMLVLGVYHVFAALGGTLRARRYAAGLSMTWWAAVAAVYIRAGWPMVSWTYSLAALTSVWCYARLSLEERWNGDGG